MDAKELLQIELAALVVAVPIVAALIRVWYLGRRNAEELASLREQDEKEKGAILTSLKDAKADCDSRLEKLEGDNEHGLSVVHERIDRTNEKVEKLTDEVHGLNTGLAKFQGSMETKFDMVMDYLKANG